MFETTRDKTLEVLGGKAYTTSIKNDDEITICISIHLEFTQSLVVITRVE
jgi:hypothetical protein